MKGRIITIGITGLATYFLLSKAINRMGHSIDKMCEASKWRAYYKSKNPDAVPPGYRTYMQSMDSTQTPAMTPTDEHATQIVSKIIADAVHSLRNHNGDIRKDTECEYCEEETPEDEEADTTDEEE